MTEGMINMIKRYNCYMFNLAHLTVLQPIVMVTHAQVVDGARLKLPSANHQSPKMKQNYLQCYS